MDTKEQTKTNYKEIIHLISTIISWTLFSILIICAIFLIYYFIAMQVYAVKGEKYEPKFSLYAIMSNSMVPNINVYDVIIDLRVDSPQDIETGDVITFISKAPETSGMTITHRVVAVIKDQEGNYFYQTKGDNAPAEDTGRVEYSNIIGKVAFKIPQLGRIQLFISNATGGILLILCIALFIILKGLVKRLLAKVGPIQFKNKLLVLLNKPLYLPYKGQVLASNEDINVQNQPLPQKEDDEWDLPDLK